MIEMGGWLDLEDVPWVSIEIVLSRHDDEQLPLKLFSPLIVGGESEKSREKESTGCV